MLISDIAYKLIKAQILNSASELNYGCKGAEQQEAYIGCGDDE